MMTIFIILGLGLTGCTLADHAPAPSAIGGPFSLTDQTGARVTQSRLLGKWTLVFFGYTYCPDVCPATLTNLGAAMQKLGDGASRTQVVFITVDPQRDTPGQLKNYLSSPSFPRNIIGLTGSAAAIASVARAYHVYYQKDGQGPGYSVDHSSLVYLMDTHGRFDRPLDVGEPPDGIARQITTAMRGR